MKRAFLGLLVVTALGLAGPSAAEQVIVNLDPARTTIAFELGATLHSVHGTFRLERGEVLYDPATGDAQGELVVSAASGESGNEKRDRDMHRKVLVSDRHPTIVLRPARIRGELAEGGTSTLTVDGRMVLQGDDHPVEIPVDVTVDGPAVRVTATFDVPYVAWGLKDPSKLVLRVAKTVTVSVDAHGTFTRPVAAGGSTQSAP